MSAVAYRNLVMLLVEDSPTDAELFLEAIAAVRIPANLHHVCDGGDALRFVRRQNPFEPFFLPPVPGLS